MAMRLQYWTYTPSLRKCQYSLASRFEFLASLPTTRASSQSHKIPRHHDNDNMKIIQLLLLSAILILKSTFAWDCSRECNDYQECRDEQNRNRELGILEPPTTADHDDEDYEDSHAIAIPPMSNLRGSAMYQNDTFRSLESFHFQVKMYWERSYCVSLFASCCASLNESLHRYPSKSHKLKKSNFLIHSFDTPTVAGRDERTKVVLGMPRFLHSGCDCRD